LVLIPVKQQKSIDGDLDQISSFFDKLILLVIEIRMDN